MVSHLQADRPAALVGAMQPVVVDDQRRAEVDQRAVLVQGAEGDVGDHGLADEGHVRYVRHSLERLVVGRVHPHQPLRRRRKRGSGGRQADDVPIPAHGVRAGVGETLIGAAVVVEALDPHRMVAPRQRPAGASPLTSVQPVVADHQGVVYVHEGAVV
eukprot:764625-Hanusia_phi.AAC.1